MSESVSTPSPSLTGAKVTWFRVFRSEWTKIWSIRSTYIVLFLAVFLMISLSLLIAWGVSVAVSEGDFDAPAAAFLDTTWLTLQGIWLAQSAIGVIGVLVVTGEYSSGMIRATLSATPRRLTVLTTKAVLAFLVSLLVMTPTVFASFSLAQLIIEDAGLSAPYSDPGVLRAVFGGSLYLAAVAVLGSALAWIMRSAVGAVFTLVALVVILPFALQFVTLDWISTIYDHLPSVAGQAVYSLGQDAGISLRDLIDADRTTFGPWEGYGVLLAWVAVGLGLSGWLLMHRDA